MSDIVLDIVKTVENKSGEACVIMKLILGWGKKGRGNGKEKTTQDELGPEETPVTLKFSS